MNDYCCIECERFVTARKWPRGWEPGKFADGIYWGTCPACCARIEYERTVDT